MLDIILAIAHHLAVFSLAGLIAMELVILRPGLSGDRLQLLGRIDGAYGALAGLVIVIGTLRVIFGDAGMGFYIANWVFWMKMAAFALVGILSIRPTIAIIGWRRAAKTEPGFTVPAEGIARNRRFLVAEALIFLSIPVFAAIMARGIGL